MGNELKTFTNEEFGQVKVGLLNNNPILNLHNVCFALGYTKQSKGKLYLRKDLIYNICKSLDIQGLSPTDNRINITKNINFTNTYIIEQDFYDLCLESKAKNARSFRKWVTNEVLPTIRKTGGYVNEGKEEEFIDNYFPTLSEETKKSMVKDLQKSVKELKPKADGYDRMINAKNNQTMNQVAKSLQVGRNKLFNFLRQKNILMKNNMPYQRFLEQGYFIVREFTKKINNEDKNLTQTLVTAKGLDYIHKKLKQVNFEIR